MPPRGKKKSTKDDVPYQCLDCNHGLEGEWKKSKYGTKACPNCGSKNTVQLKDVTAVIDDQPLMDTPAAPLGAVPLTQPTGAAGIPKPKKGAPAKAAQPLIQTIAKTSTSVDTTTRSLQEEQFAGLINDVGVKQADLLASIIMRSDRAEDPKYIDEMLRRYHIPLVQRQVIVDSWAVTIGAEPYLIGGAEAAPGGQQSPTKEMMNEMRDMFMMQMMAKMMNPEPQRPLVDPASRPQPEQQVPLTDENGKYQLDSTTGKPIMVPVSLMIMYKGQQTQDKPSSLQEFMEMMSYNMENTKMMIEVMGGTNKGPDAEMVAKNAGLEAEVRMRAMDAERGKEIANLESQIHVERALKEQESRFSDYLGEKDKRIKELGTELNRIQQDRQISYQETQVDMARKTNDLVMDTVKEMGKQNREARQEVRSLVVDNMKNQQFVDAARERVAGGRVQEVPLEQVERDISGMEGSPEDLQWDDVMLGGKEPIDYRLLEPDENPNDGVL